MFSFLEAYELEEYSRAYSYCPEVSYLIERGHQLIKQPISEQHEYLGSITTQISAHCAEELSEMIV